MKVSTENLNKYGVHYKTLEICRIEQNLKQAGAELCQAQAQVGLPAENRLN